MLEAINPLLIKPYVPNFGDRGNKKDYRETRDKDYTYRKKERYRGRDSQRRKREDSNSGGENDRRSFTPEIELSDRDKLSK